MMAPYRMPEAIWLAESLKELRSPYGAQRSVLHIFVESRTW